MNIPLTTRPKDLSQILSLKNDLDEFLTREQDNDRVR